MSVVAQRNIMIRNLTLIEVGVQVKGRYPSSGLLDQQKAALDDLRAAALPAKEGIDDVLSMHTR